MSWKGFVMGVLVGGAIGAAAALLYAPQEGTATRRRVSEATHSAVDKVSSAASAVKNKVPMVRKSVRQSI